MDLLYTYSHSTVLDVLPVPPKAHKQPYLCLTEMVIAQKYGCNWYSRVKVLVFYAFDLIVPSHAPTIGSKGTSLRRNSSQLVAMWPNDYCVRRRAVACVGHRSNVDCRKYCQFSSTDDGRQYITLSAYLCRII